MTSFATKNKPLWSRQGEDPRPEKVVHMGWRERLFGKHGNNCSSREPVRWALATSQTEGKGEAHGVDSSK